MYKQKQLFDGQEKWGIESAEAVQELKELFDGEESSIKIF